MAASVELDARSVAQLRKALHQAGGLATQALAMAGHEIMEEVVSLAAANAPADTGVLRRSAVVLPPRIAGSSITITGGFGGQAKKYAVVMHEGRRAGAKRPPVEPIKEWARRKGIDEGAAYTIAKNIGDRGIRGTKFLEVAFLTRVPSMGRDLAEGVRAALRTLDRG